MAFVALAPEDRLHIPELDAEHERMVDIVEALYNSMIPGMSDSCYSGLFQSLLDVTDIHFRHEEECWKNTDYPQAGMHREHHEELRSMIEHYRDAITDRSDPDKSQRMMEFLRAWVMNHIRSDDYDMGVYLRTHGYVGAAMH